MKEKGMRVIFMCALFLMLTSVFVFAQDDVQLAPTGQTDVSVVVGTGAAPRIYEISPIAMTSPIEYGIVLVEFSVLVEELDGLAFLDTLTFVSNFSLVGESLRQNATCENSNNLSAQIANFTCTIYMNYWDGAGDWVISASILDTDDNYFVNDTEFLTYGQLTAIIVYPSLIDFGAVSAGQFDVQPAEPTTVNNTGNAEGQIGILASDLYGETDNGFTIPATNYNADDATGTVCAGGDTLVDSVITTLTNPYSNNGDLDLPTPNGAQEDVYYCLDVPAGLTSQVYSTLDASAFAWEISLQ